MFCGKCGNQINQGERFCSKCGNIAPVEPIQNQVNVSTPKPVTRKSKGLIITSVILAVILTVSTIFAVIFFPTMIARHKIKKAVNGHNFQNLQEIYLEYFGIVESYEQSQITQSGYRITSETDAISEELANFYYGISAELESQSIQNVYEYLHAKYGNVIMDEDYNFNKPWISSGGKYYVYREVEVAYETMLSSYKRANGIGDSIGVDVGLTEYIYPSSLNVYINDVKVTFPCTVSNFVETTGWMLDSSYKGATLSPHSSYNIYDFVCDAEIFVICENPSDLEISIEDAVITVIDFKKGRAKDDFISIPYGIDFSNSYFDVLSRFDVEPIVDVQWENERRLIYSYYDSEGNVQSQIYFYFIDGLWQLVVSTGGREVPY